MGREPVEVVIEGVKVTSLPLPFAKSQPLIPKVAQVLAIAAQNLGEAFLRGLKSAEDAIKLAPAFGGLAEHLDGRLETLAPAILASTTVVLEDVKGDLQVYELGKDKDRNYVFDERPDIYFAVLIFAGRVTFSRFFPASGLSGKSARVGSTSLVSSPST